MRKEGSPRDRIANESSFRRGRLILAQASVRHGEGIGTEQEKAGGGGRGVCRMPGRLCCCFPAAGIGLCAEVLCSPQTMLCSDFGNAGSVVQESSPSITAVSS